MEKGKKTDMVTCYACGKSEEHDNCTICGKNSPKETICKECDENFTMSCLQAERRQTSTQWYKWILEKYGRSKELDAFHRKTSKKTTE